MQLFFSVAKLTEGIHSIIWLQFQLASSPKQVFLCVVQIKSKLFVTTYTPCLGCRRWTNTGLIALTHFWYYVTWRRDITRNSSPTTRPGLCGMAVWGGMTKLTSGRDGEGPPVELDPSRRKSSRHFGNIDSSLQLLTFVLYHIHTQTSDAVTFQWDEKLHSSPLLSWLGSLRKQILRKFPGNISLWSCTTRQVCSLAPDFGFLISVQSPTQQSPHSQRQLAWKWAKFGPSNGGELSECFSLLEENLSSFVVQRDWAGPGRHIFYLSPPTRPSLFVFPGMVWNSINDKSRRYW